MKKNILRETKESEVQREIMKFLRLRGCCVFKHRNVGIYIAKKNKYIPLADGEKGISDIIGYIGDGTSRFIACEVKRRGKTPCKDGKPSKEQLEFIQKVKDKGGLACVAYDLDDVINMLKQQ